jgi:hypothetical protein
MIFLVTGGQFPHEAVVNSSSNSFFTGVCPNTEPQIIMAKINKLNVDFFIIMSTLIFIQKMYEGKFIKEF